MGMIKFRVAAKTDVGLVRKNNEDNFQVASDLSSGQMRWVNNEVCSLGEKGALLVVADGMGGMNAGEVASDLAIKAVREYFSPENITPDVTKNRFSIEKYMNDVIVAADAKIKREAKNNPETRGMGTTIVIGWILDGKLYVSWCGDSRAYIYNPQAGLHQITKDHSYVQSLVDKGVITKEDAFDYPDSNIITRSLSDGAPKAKPESLLKPYDLCDNDIILLCTDGLSGMIRDSEMEAVIRRNENDMDVLSDELIRAACDAEGSDNITLCLCQILQGCGTCNPSVFRDSDSRLSGNNGGGGANTIVRTVIGGLGGRQDDEDEGRRWKRNFFILAIVLAVIVAGGIAGWYFLRNGKGKEAPIVAGPGSITVVDEGASKQDTVTTPPTVETPPTDKPGGKGAGKTGTGLKELDKLKEKAMDSEKTDDSGQDESAKGHDPNLYPTGKNINGTTVKPEEKESETESDDNSGKDNDKEDKDKDPKTSGEVQTVKYKVKKGNTLYGIAKMYKTTEKEIKRLNPELKEKSLEAGMEINVPKKK